MPKPATECPTAAASYEAEFIDSAAFAAMTYEREWLIEGLLVKGEAAVLGGPKKALKTSITVDMAVSIATATPCLGTFVVPKARRVAVISGETAEHDLQETARRVCKAKGIPFGRRCRVSWCFRLPRLSNAADVSDLRRALADLKAQVVFLDPLYLCLLGADKAADATNLFAVGPLLARAVRACKAAGATPVFLHHLTKKAGTAGDASLDDLAFAGIGEFARQWLLVTRQQPYREGSGRHDLKLGAGGSAGHSGAWHVTVEEGRLAADFTGRCWRTRVTAAKEDSAEERRPLRRQAP